MARVIVCDDKLSVTNLVTALSEAGHETETCHQAMDALLKARNSHFDLVVIGIDAAGSGRNNTVEVLNQIAPHLRIIALHEKPSEIIHTTARSGIAAVLPRSVSINDFMYAVARSLEMERLLSKPCAPV
jgi:DNA-binding NtrC family response regulator